MSIQNVILKKVLDFLTNELQNELAERISSLQDPRFNNTPIPTIYNDGKKIIISVEGSFQSLNLAKASLYIIILNKNVTYVPYGTLSLSIIPILKYNELEELNFLLDLNLIKIEQLIHCFTVNTDMTLRSAGLENLNLGNFRWELTKTESLNYSIDQIINSTGTFIIDPTLSEALSFFIRKRCYYGQLFNYSEIRNSIDNWIKNNIPRPSNFFTKVASMNYL